MMRITKNLLLVSPTILALLLLAAHLASKGEQSREAEREAPIHKAFTLAVDKGVATLTVDAASQARSGIRMRVLSGAQTTSGPLVYGTVIDVQPLLELSGRHAAGVGELRVAQAELGQRQAELKRAQALYEDGQNVSRKVFDAARTDLEASRAKVEAAKIASVSIGTALRQQFGPVLASWALAPSSPEMAALAARRNVLVRVVSVPPEREAPRVLTLSEDSKKSVAARLVSPSPQTDPGIPGQTYFYQVRTPLGVGMRLTGHLDVGAPAGLRIPAEAVVWYGGQPWAYVRANATRFERRLVEQGAASDGSFVVTHGFRPGEAVVVQGAQLLLSEEGRATLSDD